jgi:hypothetical protein
MAQKKSRVKFSYTQILTRVSLFFAKLRTLIFALALNIKGFIIKIKIFIFLFSTELPRFPSSKCLPRV